MIFEFTREELKELIELRDTHTDGGRVSIAGKEIWRFTVFPQENEK